MQPAHGKCGSCGGNLLRGYVHVHGTLWGFVLFGVSWHDLYFVPECTPADRQPILPFRSKAAAYRCLGCGMVAVTRERWSGAEAEPHAEGEGAGSRGTEI